MPIVAKRGAGSRRERAGVAATGWLALIGVGNQFRRDDAAGLEVARRLRLTRPPGVEIFEEEGEPASLIEAWS